MLVNIPKQHFGKSIWRDPTPVAPGIYEAAGMGFGYWLKDAGVFADQYAFTHEWKASGFQGEYTPDYGVCDDWGQILSVFPYLLEDPRQFVIGLSEVRRADQPPNNGWRWHKNGTYIGAHDIKYEYLADEKGIDRVWMFEIIQVKL